MKRKLINIAKQIYARLLRFNIVWQNRKRISRIVRKVRKHNLERFKNKLMKQYEYYENWSSLFETQKA